MGDRAIGTETLFLIANLFQWKFQTKISGCISLCVNNAEVPNKKMTPCKSQKAQYQISELIFNLFPLYPVDLIDFTLQIADPYICPFTGPHANSIECRGDEEMQLQRVKSTCQYKAECSVSFGIGIGTHLTVGLS